ncbi:MAG: ABC transporter [Gammaproteobacteria bacterium]|nr:MAG: ABC transporter [Gammaproteobacteria bacterium]
MIAIEGLTYQYASASEPALVAIDLNVGDGELFGLLGPNGAGKTTLMSLLTGLRKVQNGRITIGGMDLSHERGQVQKAIAWIPQEYAFYPSLTATENLNFFAGVQGIRGETVQQRINEATEITGLKHVLSKRAALFSGGLKRRLNIAIGLLNQPQWLFLDEPTVGIDPQSRQFILQAIRDINARGTTVIYTSHYMDEVEFLCDRIAIIDHGRVLVCGSLLELLAQGKTGAASISLQQQLPQGFVLPESVEISAGGLQLRIESITELDLGKLLQSLANDGVNIARLNYGTYNLQDLFLQLTHRSLRD